MITLIAIDPGANGGIAIKHGANPASCFKMPDTEGDLISLLAAQRLIADVNQAPCVAIVEDQAGFCPPGGKVSSGAMCGAKPRHPWPDRVRRTAAITIQVTPRSGSESLAVSGRKTFDRRDLASTQRLSSRVRTGRDPGVKDSVSPLT